MADVGSQVSCIIPSIFYLCVTWFTPAVLNSSPIDMLPIHNVHCSLLPDEGKSVVVNFTLEHSFMVCAAQRLQAQTSVTSYTSDIYNFNSRLAHLYALWMEYIRFELESWRNILWFPLQHLRSNRTNIWSDKSNIRNVQSGGEDWNWEPLIYTQRVFSRSCLPGCS